MPLVQCNIFGETVRLVAAEVTWYLKYQVVLPDGRQTYNQVYTVTLQYVLSQTSFTTHSVQYIQYTLSVHLTLL